MPLKLMYITNSPSVAAVADKHGVDRIFIDLEQLDKEARQKNMDTVKSQHALSDIPAVKSVLTKSDLLVRVNHIYQGSQKEIDQVIAAGADLVMLPYFKTREEVDKFISFVGGRAKTVLLLETKEAAENIDEILAADGIDEVHIGLNDLHLSYKLNFMFELLTNGTVEKLCRKIKERGIPYGFGGVARLGCGALPAEKIILEHYRLGSTRAILSRSFCNAPDFADVNSLDKFFGENLAQLREFEKYAASAGDSVYAQNRNDVENTVAAIVKRLRTEN